MHWYSEITSRWKPATSANSWQLYGEKLNWRQFVAVMVELFSVWGRRENAAGCWTGTLPYMMFWVFWVFLKLESIFLQNSPSFQLTEATVMLLFLWRNSFCFLFFQARDNENYEPLICLYVFCKQYIKMTYWK